MTTNLENDKLRGGRRVENTITCKMIQKNETTYIYIYIYTYIFGQMFYALAAAAATSLLASIVDC